VRCYLLFAKQSLGIDSKQFFPSSENQEEKRKSSNYGAASKQHGEDLYYNNNTKKICITKTTPRKRIYITPTTTIRASFR
jgi:hypothetical protein